MGGSDRRFPLLDELRADQRLIPFAVAIFCTYAYFVGPAAWNQNSRFALTRALVEHRSTIIDPWAYATGDKSFRDGHFYSDKAPGVSLLATVPHAILVLSRTVTSRELPDARVEPLDPIEAAAGRSPRPDQMKPGDRLVYNPAHRIATWWARLCSVTVVSMFGLAALLLVARRELEDPSKARLVVLAYAFGTPAFAYSCAFYGHQATAAFLFVAFALTILAPRDLSPRSLGLAIGTCLGWAVLCEYTAALPSVLLVAWIFVRRGSRPLPFVLLAGALWAAVLAAYHLAAFGHPLRTGYDFVHLPEFAEGMRVRYGIAWPDPWVLVQIFFGRYRGLFWVAPVTLLAAFGLVRFIVLAPRVPAEGRLGVGDLVVAGTIVAYYFLLNAGYYMWDGGASLGPRHAVPALPFLALGLVIAVRELPWATSVIALVSAGLMTLATAVGPEAPSYGDPIFDHAVSALFRDPQDPGAATTLGNVIGLWGPLGLAPLVLAWGFLRPPEFAPAAFAWLAQRRDT